MPIRRPCTSALQGALGLPPGLRQRPAAQPEHPLRLCRWARAGSTQAKWAGGLYLGPWNGFWNPLGSSDRFSLLRITALSWFSLNTVPAWDVNGKQASGPTVDSRAYLLVSFLCAPFCWDCLCCMLSPSAPHSSTFWREHQSTRSRKCLPGVLLRK